MTAQEKVYSILSAAAGVTALVPAARIKPQGDWQDLAKPYIVHFPAAGEPITCHSGLMPMRIWTYQVSVFTSSTSSAHAIADAVVTAMAGYKDSDTDPIILTRPPLDLGYDTDLKIQHVAIEFQIAGALT